MSLETIGLNDRTIDNDNNQDGSSNLEETGNQNVQDAGESSSSSSEMTYDIGKTFKENSVDNLTDHRKYLIVKNRSIPGSSFSSPKSFKYGCARSCKPNYLIASFVYSQNDDAVFCLQCSMFLNSDVRSKLSSFVTRGYTEWHNIQEKQKRHVGNSYHTDAMVKALEINDKFEKPANTIEYQTNKEIQNRHKIYPQLV